MSVKDFSAEELSAFRDGIVGRTLDGELQWYWRNERGDAEDTTPVLLCGDARVTLYDNRNWCERCSELLSECACCGDESVPGIAEIEFNVHGYGLTIKSTVYPEVAAIADYLKSKELPRIPYTKTKRFIRPRIEILSMFLPGKPAP